MLPGRHFRIHFNVLLLDFIDGGNGVPDFYAQLGPLVDGGAFYAFTILFRSTSTGEVLSSGKS